MERFKCTVNKLAKSTEVETHLSIELSKKNFGGTLRPKSVRRTLVIGLIYRSRENKQRSECQYLSPDDCFHV